MAITFTTSCTACSGDWRVLAHDSGCKQYSYCRQCTRRVFHGAPEHVGEQCACGCLERIEDGCERIEADGKVYVPWHYVSVQRELAGVERFDDEAACQAEVERLRAAYVARVACAVDGSFASLACDALGGLVLVTVMVAPWVV